MVKTAGISYGLFVALLASCEYTQDVVDMCSRIRTKSVVSNKAACSDTFRSCFRFLILNFETK